MNFMISVTLYNAETLKKVFHTVSPVLVLGKSALLVKMQSLNCLYVG